MTGKAAGQGAGRSGAVPRLHRQLHDLLAADLAAGRIAGGAVLSEAAVAARFGTSRAPARQALAALAQAGRLTRVPGRGYLVPGAAQVVGGGDPAPRLLPLASWEQIYGEVEYEIAARSALGSWHVNESRLAQHYGVSRTVAREVLARLQQRGQIRKDGRSRWIAPGLTTRYVGELYRMRALLEPAALREAAALVPRAVLARMRGNLAGALEGAADLVGADLDRLERELHVELLSYNPDRTLAEAIGLYQSLLVAHSFLYAWTPQIFAPAEPFLGEHLRIIDHLLAGDTGRACDDLVLHLGASRERSNHRIAWAREWIRPPPLPYLTADGAAADPA